MAKQISEMDRARVAVKQIAATLGVSAESVVESIVREQDALNGRVKCDLVTINGVPKLVPAGARLTVENLGKAWGIGPNQVMRIG